MPIPVSIVMEQDQFNLNKATVSEDQLPAGLTAASRSAWNHFGEHNIIAADPDFAPIKENKTFQQMGKALGLVSLLMLIHVRTRRDGVWPLPCAASQALLKSKAGTQRALATASVNNDTEYTLVRWFLSEYTFKAGHGSPGNTVLQRLRSTNAEFFGQVNEQLIRKKELELGANLPRGYIFAHVLADVVSNYTESDEADSIAVKAIERNHDASNPRRLKNGTMRSPVINYVLRNGN